MKSIKICLLTLFTLLSTFLNAQEQNNKAVSIVEKALDAMGGKEFIKSINTLYTNSETQMQGRDVNWIVKEMLPNIGSFEIVYQNRTVYKSWYDGEKGYELNNGQKVLGDQENYKDKPLKKNIFNELDYLDATLYNLDYLGIEEFESNKCHKIKATSVIDKVVFLYFDSKSGFLIKSETVNGAKDSFSTVVFSDFKKFNKLTYFSKMKFGVEKDAQSAKIIELLYNEKVSASDFK
ncbi:hypothetical protein HNP37_002489 [Flavobacterium nitrogenifigens]|uniref:Outer membrane lipoprotein-sorting protein n=2 Tax=Flavobacterium TaxID=237 RepID=A0A7W7IXI5_9FLAO|nr:MULTISPECIES: hypothetical protein [Flavobacterium]MBB4802416.1 hypothetical protein [Flavobacterium nitrogenifigens]MBB6387374.1 hypothetical protein [Flavobacterium notoginsengisoli]